MLLTSARTSPPEPSTVSAARTGRLEGNSSGAGLSGTALGVLATLGLLGLGALVESRRAAGALLPLSGKWGQ